MKFLSWWRCSCWSRCGRCTRTTACGSRSIATRVPGGPVRRGSSARRHRLGLAVVPAVAATFAVHRLLHGVNPFAGLVVELGGAVLHQGLPPVQHDYGEIQQSLKGGDLAAARERLGRWRGESATEFSAGEVARCHRAGRARIAPPRVRHHRWFLALGPAGAVLYRACAVLADKWRLPPRRVPASSAASPRAPSSGSIGCRSVERRHLRRRRRFRGCVYCWRTQANRLDRVRTASSLRPAAARWACASATRCTSTAA